MRTTINLQDDAFEAASAFATARQMKLGDAVSELVRRGIGKVREPVVKVKEKNGIWVFATGRNPAVPKVTADRVKALIDDTP